MRPIATTTSLALLLAFAAPVAEAQAPPPPAAAPASASASASAPAPATITDAAIRDFQQQMENGCMKRGRERGDADASVDRFCRCMTRTLQDAIPGDDWQRILAFALANRDDDVMEILKRYLPRVQACVPDAS